MLPGLFVFELPRDSIIRKVLGKPPVRAHERANSVGFIEVLGNSIYVLLAQPFRFLVAAFDLLR